MICCTVVEVVCKDSAKHLILSAVSEDMRQRGSRVTMSPGKLRWPSGIERPSLEL